MRTPLQLMKQAKEHCTKKRVWNCQPPYTFHILPEEWNSFKRWLKKNRPKGVTVFKWDIFPYPGADFSYEEYDVMIFGQKVQVWE